MYHQLATRFGGRSHEITGRTPLDDDALRAHVPSIFAGEAHDSRSDRYVYVPSMEIVEGSRREAGSRLSRFSRSPVTASAPYGTLRCVYRTVVKVCLVTCATHAPIAAKRRWSNPCGGAIAGLGDQT